MELRTILILGVGFGLAFCGLALYLINILDSVR